MKFSLCGVLRRIKDFAFHINAFEITPKGIQDAILRVGDACKTAYSANIDKNCGVELYGQIFRFSVKTIGSGLSGRLMAK